MTKEKTEFTPEEVIERYADMVYRLALLQVKNRTDADDIFQEVFVRLVKYFDKLESWEHIKAWLIRVTINCSKKHFAGYWNKNVFPMEEMEEVQREEEGYALLEQDSPVTAAVRQLSPKYRAVVHLFYYEELSVGEIAAATRQKESTVKSQLFRAREMLREALKGENDI